MTLRIGGVYEHPKHGRIYITDGAYEIDRRVSNHWSYRVVKNDGTLAPHEYHDYGGDWKQLKATVKVTTIVKVHKKQ